MRTEPKIPKRFCTTREAAALLGVSLKTAQLWSENGLLTAWRTAGGHRRIVRESIERLLVSRPAAGRAGVVERVEVLVVAGEPGQRGVYAEQIARWALAPDVSVAADGVEALLRIGRRVPDLLVADLDNAGPDAVRMLRRLRGMAEVASMAIVAVTALSDADLAARGGLPGDIPVFAKPLEFAALEQAASAFVAARRQGAELMAVA